MPPIAIKVGLSRRNRFQVAVQMISGPRCEFFERVKALIILHVEPKF